MPSSKRKSEPKPGPTPNSALRTGLFHLFLNVTTVALGVLFAGQLATLAEWTARGADVSRQLANAHVMFNLFGVLLLIGFLPLIAHALQRLVPDDNEAAARPTARDIAPVQQS